jgi:prolyl oligopeptidase
MAAISYPPARRSGVVDDHFGEKVADPYRWLEDPNDPDTRAWIEAENALTESVLAAVQGRSGIRARVTELWDYPKFGVPFERGGRWFQTRNSGLQSQSVLYVSQEAGEEGRVLLDPNLLSTDGTAALTGLQVSRDGKLAAYAVSESGSDWMTWHVRDVESGQDLPDQVEWSKFSLAAWTRDSAGFYYSGLDRPVAGGEFREESRGLSVRFHLLGTPQAGDRIVFAAPDQPDWLPRAEVSDDGRYLIITVNRGTAPENDLLIVDLEEQDGQPVGLSTGFKAKSVFVGNDRTRVYLLTDLDAERGRVVAADLEHPDAAWEEIIPETPDTLLDVQLCGGKLVCHYLRHAHSVLQIHDPPGPLLRQVAPPGFVSIVGDPLGHGSVEGRPERDVFYFQAVSFVESGSLWSHDVATGDTTLVRGSASLIDPQEFLTEQVFATSGDGTQVPMFLIRRRDISADGDQRVLLYGYGGFNIPLTPSFGVTFATWLDRGGVLAVANLRGGGEYGRGWHDGGRLANKQNVFDDFYACARWLAGSWSRPQRIGISGGSNGGLLVGTSITQHPELFGGALADVGVFDMLRFHKFTIGWAWKSDYGDPDDPSQYAWLRAYSPLHNVRDQVCVPPTMILTGDHDDRVVPGHSLKFAATVQAAQACNAPVLLRVETSAGHGLGKPTGKLIDEATDRVTFLEWSLTETSGEAGKRGLR